MYLPIVRLKRIVFFDEETQTLCQCQGDFWKTCPLRARGSLPCTESIISITPIDRTDGPLIPDQVRSLDVKLKDLTDKMKLLSKKDIY